MKLPLSPGVYIMRDKDGKIIYIGKAKALKNRVSQYFGSDANHDDKVKKMVENACDFDYILTDSEYEALVLECSLIKQYKPKYNILLKDDRGFHYIRISDGDFPKISVFGKPLEDGAKYLGPYNSSYAVKQAVETANKAFRLSDCSKILVSGKRSKPCLNSHIGLCMAPCSGRISSNEYKTIVSEALDFISGGQDNTVRLLTKKMENAAEHLEFEQAAKLRDRIKWVKSINSRQKVVMSKVSEQDIIALECGEGKCCFEIFRFLNGRLHDTEHHILEHSEDLGALYFDFVISYYEMRDRIPALVVLDKEPKDKTLLKQYLSRKAGRAVTVTVPQKGESAQLAALCKKNAAERITHITGRREKDTAVLAELAKLLNLKEPPRYIESYDISNLANDNIVCGMVVYLDAKPLRSAYKKFALKDVEIQDDYASMTEVITRRFKRYFEQKDTNEGFGRLPDLILLDGGAAHVSVVKRTLDGLGLDIPLFGMVKDDKHKTRAIASSDGEIALAKTRSVYTFVSEIQEEVHRFAITFQKTKHKGKAFKSSLSDIDGIGQTRIKLLLKHFKTIKSIKEATVEELILVKGMNRAAAQAVFDYFSSSAK